MRHWPKGSTQYLHRIGQRDVWFHLSWSSMSHDFWSSTVALLNSVCRSSRSTKCGVEQSLNKSISVCKTHPYNLCYAHYKCFIFPLVQGSMLLGKPTALRDSQVRYWWRGNLNPIPAAAPLWNLFNYIVHKSTNTFQSIHLSLLSKENPFANCT